MDYKVKQILKESAKDFMYFGYSLKSFLEYDSFSHIDKEELKSIWEEALNEQQSNF